MENLLTVYFRNAKLKCNNFLGASLRMLKTGRICDSGEYEKRPIMSFRVKAVVNLVCPRHFLIISRCKQT